MSYEPRLRPTTLAGCAGCTGVEASGDRPMEGSCGVGGGSRSRSGDALHFTRVVAMLVRKGYRFSKIENGSQNETVTPTHCAAARLLCAYYLHIFFFPKFRGDRFMCTRIYHWHYHFLLNAIGALWCGGPRWVQPFGNCKNVWPFACCVATSRTLRWW